MRVGVRAEEGRDGGVLCVYDHWHSSAESMGRLENSGERAPERCENLINAPFAPPSEPFSPPSAT